MKISNLYPKLLLNISELSSVKFEDKVPGANLLLNPSAGECTEGCLR